MDESTFGWLIEYEQQLREAGAKKNGENCTDEEANHTADWLSENRYCFWTTIKELLNYE